MTTTARTRLVASLHSLAFSFLHGAHRMDTHAHDGRSTLDRDLDLRDEVAANGEPGSDATDAVDVALVHGTDFGVVTPAARRNDGRRGTRALMDGRTKVVMDGRSGPAGAGHEPALRLFVKRLLGRGMPSVAVPDAGRTRTVVSTGARAGKTSRGLTRVFAAMDEAGFFRSAGTATDPVEPAVEQPAAAPRKVPGAFGRVKGVLPRATLARHRAAAAA